MGAKLYGGVVASILYVVILRLTSGPPFCNTSQEIFVGPFFCSYSIALVFGFWIFLPLTILLGVFIGYLISKMKNHNKLSK